MRQRHSALLERDGHSVVVANDGRKGLKWFESGQFDLLIVDIFMPGMDGLETMRLVHQQRPEIPILVISGQPFASDSKPTPDFLYMATKLGAISSLRKPFRPAELLSSRSKLSRNRSQISSKPPNLASE